MFSDFPKKGVIGLEEEDLGLKNSPEVFEHIRKARTGSKESYEWLLKRGAKLIAKGVRKYYIHPNEVDNFLHSATVGFIEAIADFKEDSEIAFESFAYICIEREVIDEMKSFGRQKRKFARSALSLDQPLNEDDDGGSCNLYDFIPSRATSAKTFEELFESVDEICRFTDLERQVIMLYDQGYKYQEMAEIVERGSKGIDNTRQRVGKKALEKGITPAWVHEIAALPI